MTRAIGDLLDLRGRRAVVTGAAQGFGYAVALRLAQAGATVFVVDRDAERSLMAAERINGDDVAEPALAATADVSNERDVESLYDQVGAVDLLVNNAGVFSNARAEDLEVDEFDRIHAVNVRGTFLCSREFARRRKASGAPGAIVNIASVDAINPSCEGQVHYTASKHAVAGLTKALSVELAPKGIRVNAVCPGASMTEGAIELVSSSAPHGIDLGEQWAGIAARTPMGSIIEPDDVALAALFLLSDMAARITGILLPVDGGILSQPLEGYVG